jgi:hypothetical protein
VGGACRFERLLSDPKTLSTLVIEYEPGDTTSLFVYGTGIVVKQAHPSPSPGLLPTCTGTVDQDELKQLIRTFITHHFFDLPVRSYLYVTASDDMDDFWRALKLHSITLDDNETRASRQFAEGMYQDRKEPIPQVFSKIEEVLQRIEREATQGKPCHMEPAVKLPPLRSSQPVPSSFPS